MPRDGVPRSVEPMTSRPKIIVGIDGSSRGADALKFASVLANAVGTGLLLVHVYGPGEDRRTAREILESHRATVQDVPVEVIAHADPSPARALDRVAAAHQAAVIVVGPSHRAGLGLVLPGSTGQQLLHDHPPDGGGRAPRMAPERGGHAAPHRLRLRPFRTSPRRRSRRPPS